MQTKNDIIQGAGQLGQKDVMGWGGWGRGAGGGQANNTGIIEI
jgi:hypothetical protein